MEGGADTALIAEGGDGRLLPQGAQDEAPKHLAPKNLVLGSHRCGCGLCDCDCAFDRT